MLFGIAFLATIVIVMAQAVSDPGISTFWERTISFQSGRGSPFSIWGQTSLEPLHIAVEVLAGVLALLVAFRPKRKDPYVVAALGAAVLIAFELTVTHWFYLYIPWFFALLVIPLAAGVTPGRASGSARPSQPAPAR
jgi:peptidoglycan/LPS O-acetylase OafA/YrhL